ncbi:HPP family protein [Microcoleus vaginatus]|uniref:HPP family protein n=1 Tax=Microcoleus vaginatus TaxID=119532 RepID=UPI0040407CFB
MALLATARVLTVLALVEVMSRQRLLFASLASSSFLIYLDPLHRTNAVRTLVTSHMMAATMGWLTYLIVGPGYPSAGTAMVITIVLRILLYLLIVSSLGIAIGAWWEVAEWTAGIVLSTEVIEIPNDTMINLIMDSLESAIAALTSLWTLQEWMRQALRQYGIKHRSPIVRAIALNSKPYHKFFLNHLPSGGYFFMASDRWQG